MKKTLSINISGLVFHIDEDAYERLHSYLEGIKRHFGNREGHEEIIADIEGRISEILHSKLSESKKVITLEDIVEVMGVMGQPDEFDAGEEQAPGATGHMPQSKRLYRDPEQKIIGGVCAGIGSYFFIDPLWVRIVFLVLTFSGFGILLYLILWIVVPEARTTAEKLEMRGRPVNVSTIEESIREEVNELKEKINGLTGKAKEGYRRQKADFDRNQRPRVQQGISDLGHVLVRILLICIGIVIFFIGLALTAVFLAVIFRVPTFFLMEHGGPDFFPLYPALDMIFRNDSDLRTFATGLIVVAGVPLLMMLWGSIRLIFNLPRARFLSSIASFVWVCGLVITLIFGFKAYNAFRFEGEYTKETRLTLNAQDTLRIATPLSLPEKLEWNRSGHYYFREWNMVLANDGQLYYGIPQLRIRPAADTLASMTALARARGPFTDEAETSAQNIDYGWNQSGDSLIFPDHFLLAEGEKWRRQELRLDLYLPAGTVVTIDKNAHRILTGSSRISRRDLSGGVFVMKEDGLERIGK